MNLDDFFEDENETVITEKQNIIINDTTKLKSNEKICLGCGEKYIFKKQKQKFCSTCRDNDVAYCDKHQKVYKRNHKCLDCLIENSRIKYNESNKDLWIECKICGYRGGDLTGHIMNHHKISIEEYKKLTGETKLKSQVAINRMTGENNIAFGHNGTLSAFSDNFIYADKVDKEEIKKKAAQNRKDNNGNTTNIEYYLKQGFDLETSKKLLSDRQTTFSLEICIEKYGEIEGTKRWNKRQEQWLSNYKKTNFSKISQDLFWNIFEKLDDINDIYFAELNKLDNTLDNSGKNNEYTLKLKNTSIKPDFINTKSKKILEFDGTYWHDKQQNPKREAERDDEIIKSGYKVLHIKEIHYLQNKQKCIDACLQFLKD